jgi:hypothetical protein
LRLPEAWWTGSWEKREIYIFIVDVKLCRYRLHVAEWETGISTGTRCPR